MAKKNCLIYSLMIILVTISHLFNAMSDEKVRLKNGAIVPKAYVPLIMNNIKALMKKDGAVFYEFVDKCRYECNQLEIDSCKILAQYKLVNSYDYTIANLVKNVVLSAVEDDYFSVKLVDPINRK